MTTSIVLTRPLSSSPPATSAFVESTINGQPMLTFPDSVRGNKILSISEQNHIFTRGRVDDLDWLRLGNVAHAESGFIAEFDGCVCYVSAHCENTDTSEKDVHLFVDDVDQGNIGTLSGGENSTFVNTTLDIDYTRGQKIRLQAQDVSGSTPGNIQDVVVNLTIKHRLVP